MENPLKEMITKRKRGIHCGIPSFCCANQIVIEAVLEQAWRFGDMPLIEATSNQVNQDGGYMHMTPIDFRNYVDHTADQLGISRDKVIIGGDHMGPLPWVDLPAEQAMGNAKILVSQCVRAGYEKIHLDTSMRLGDDPETEPLSDEVIAERGVELYQVCEETYQDMLEENPDLIHPVFVIGSEVPVPGGARGEEGTCAVTRPEDFERTLAAYKKKFHEFHLDNAWENIIAVVVQPGVEFGNGTIHQYNREDAKDLCNTLRKYPDLVFEGHSTDYQPPEKLRQMVEDGIAIIKVGPALTFSLREALFDLSMMEDELMEDKSNCSHFREVLDEAMLRDPEYWDQYYFGTEHEKKIMREYSYSDRSRYYMLKPDVEAARKKLFKNINSLDIPMSMLEQYMPQQYIKVRDGLLNLDARSLAKDSVISLIEDYNYAVKYNYMIGELFVN